MLTMTRGGQTARVWEVACSHSTSVGSCRKQQSASPCFQEADGQGPWVCLLPLSEQGRETLFASNSLSISYLVAMSLLIFCGLLWTNQARSRELVEDFDAIGHYPVADPEECGSADEVGQKLLEPGLLWPGGP